MLILYLLEAFSWLVTVMCLVYWLVILLLQIDKNGNKDNG